MKKIISINLVCDSYKENILYYDTDLIKGETTLINAKLNFGSNLYKSIEIEIRDLTKEDQKEINKMIGERAKRVNIINYSKNKSKD